MVRQALQLAHRELHSLARQRAVWVGCLAAGVILGLAAPFNTAEIMRTGPAIVYWCAVASISFVTGSVLAAVAIGLWPRGDATRWFAVLLGAVLSGIVITAELFGLNAFVFGWVPERAELFSLLGNVTAIAVVVSFAAAYVNGADQSPVEAQSDAPRILNRLPFDKRGALISLTAVDHYVEVTTENGTELVLMRLADAIDETAPEAGLQIHRSHWVALRQVQGVERTNGKTEITLPNARALPVSRSNLKALKEVGLLPG